MHDRLPHLGATLAAALLTFALASPAIAEDFPTPAAPAAAAPSSAPAVLEDVTMPAAVTVTLDSSIWENLVTGNLPAVFLQGNSEGETTVITLFDADVTGNNTGGGIVCVGCLFAADPDAAGVQTVNTSTLQLGNSAGARVEFTALQLFGCAGAWAINTLTVWQVDGDPAGYVNTGPLGLTISTEVVDVAAP